MCSAAPSIQLHPGNAQKPFTPAGKIAGAHDSVCNMWDPHLLCSDAQLHTTLCSNCSKYSEQAHTHKKKTEKFKDSGFFSYSVLEKEKLKL